jgi:hypothetical protein
VESGSHLCSISFNPFGSDAPKEISAISITPIDRTHHKSRYIVVSCWETNEVAILVHNDQSMTTVLKTGPHESFPRSLLLYNFGLDKRPKKKSGESDYLPYLLIGMADGTLTSYAFEAQSTETPKVKKYSLKDKKTVSLGTTPVNLTAVEFDDRPAVCACGSRASFLFHSQGRLQQAPVLVNVCRIYSHRKSRLTKIIRELRP